jgi:hypothetical protein
MTTTMTTTNPVRSDVLDSHAEAESRRTARGWAFAGAAAGVCGIGTLVTSSMIDVVYQQRYVTDDHGLATALQDKAGAILAFHALTVVGALLLVVFAAGLYRRLRAGMSDSIAPFVAGVGLVGTAVVLIMGSGLDTEFSTGPSDEVSVSDSSAAMFNHWVGTIPWLFTMAGLAGLAVYAASRRGVVPRWIGRTGLVLGGLTVLLGISPLQYMSGAPAVLMLVAIGLGFGLGDRRHRV